VKTVDLTVAAVATWRITHLLLYENGPFRAFRKLRERFGVVYADADSSEVVSFQYEITTCAWCLSVWVATVVTLLQLLSSKARWLWLPFTYSAAAVIINRLMERDRQKFPEFTIK
jgi:hypothetical protein